MALQTSEVFGLNTEINEYSYIDRGGLDTHIQTQGNRSWL
jgi:hypothetical protein